MRQRKILNLYAPEISLDFCRFLRVIPNKAGLYGYIGNSDNVRSETFYLQRKRIAT